MIRHYINIVESSLNKTQQIEIAVLIDQVKDSFDNNMPYDAIEWLADAGYTVQHSDQLKSLFNANIKKIAALVIEQLRDFGDHTDYHVFTKMREQLESIGIAMPNDQIANSLYNQTRYVYQALKNMVDNNQVIVAINVAEELEHWGLEIILDDYIHLDEKQLKKLIIGSLIHDNYNKQNIINTIAYIRNQGYDYPEFDVILSNI